MWYDSRAGNRGAETSDEGARAYSLANLLPWLTIRFLWGEGGHFLESGAQAFMPAVW